MKLGKCLSALFLGLILSAPLAAGPFPLSEVIKRAKGDRFMNEPNPYNTHLGVNVLVEFGIASWYDCPTKPEYVKNPKFGLQDHIYPVAHKTLPFGTLIKVINPANGKKILVRVIDRGPFIAGRIIDLDRPGAQALGIGGVGKIILKIFKVDPKQVASARSTTKSAL